MRGPPTSLPITRRRRTFAIPSSQQSEAQEGNLVLLFPEVSDSARPDYTEAVAAVHNARLPWCRRASSASSPKSSPRACSTSPGGRSRSAPDLWTVGGLEVRVDETTIGAGRAPARARRRASSSARTPAASSALSPQTIVQTDLPPSDSVVSGQVEQVTDQGIVIGGQLIPITAQTLRTGKLKAGQKVEVKLGKSEAGTVAETVRPAPRRRHGRLVRAVYV